MTDEANSYRRRSFRVVDQDARLRDPDNLMTHLRRGEPDAHGNIPFATIPKDTIVHVDQARNVDRGVDGPLVFAHATDPNGNPIGWTSTRNFEGKFVNETLAAMPPGDNDRKGPNAAWSGGRFLRQVTLIPIVGARLQLLYLAADTVGPYFELVRAAAAENITIAINSGFRTWREQKALYDGYRRGLPGYNLAAEPGRSKHQNGLAFDIDVPGGAGTPTYDWLVANATRFGFLRTVNKEPWHWEYDPPQAAAARAAGTFKLDRVAI